MKNGRLAVDYVTDLEARRGGNWDRREFVKGLAALTGSAGLLGYNPRQAAAEPPPETIRIRLVRESSICLAPVYIAEEFLQAEGFSDVQYVPLEGTLGTGQMLGAGKADLGADAAPALILNLEAGEPIVLFGGVHVGCYELFGTDRVRTIRDLKGKKVAVTQLRDDRHAFIAAMAAHVGLDPRKDINWVVHPVEEAVQLLKEGRIDAFIGFPPEPQEAARQEDWARGGQHRGGQAVVTVLLLHGRGEPGLRHEAPGGDQAGTPRALEGSGSLRPRAGARCPLPGG